MATITFNLPLMAIPAFYVLAVVPHGYAVQIASKGNPRKHDNRNPRSSQYMENMKKRLTAQELAAYERAESCHRNHLENFPLFIAAIFAAMLAEQKVGEGEVGLIEFVIGWMVLRSIYTVNYLITETIGWSYLRSVLYFVSTFWAFIIIGRASFILGS